MWQLQERFQENIYLKRGKRMRKNVGKKKLLLTVLSALALSLAATIGAFADESDTSRLVSGTKINGIGVGGLTPDEAKSRIEGFYAGECKLSNNLQ